MKWIKCSDKMPEDCLQVICSDEEGHMWIAWFNYVDFTWTTWPDKDNFKDGLNDDDDFMPVYWRNTPDSPDETNVQNFIKD